MRKKRANEITSTTLAADIYKCVNMFHLRTILGNTLLMLSGNSASLRRENYTFCVWFEHVFLIYMLLLDYAPQKAGFQLYHACV